MDASTALLGGLTPARFLAEHWQKKPLLVRQALPGFGGLLSAQELCALARKKDAVSRVVRPRGGKLVVEHGPFKTDALDPGARAAAPWSVLVQGVENHVDGAWDLLARFSFLPTARIDDLMVSFAQPGGGVGPHFDLYDVFLLQGPGKRRWSISTDRSLTRGEGRAVAPFTPTDTWVLDPGDMLYLPPRIAHWGEAVDACMTYSIGLLAPTHEQIVANFAAFLDHRPAPPGMYSDADLTLQERPAAISEAALARVVDTLAVAEFWGRFLTGPKPGVTFSRPKGRVDVAALTQVKLARASRMLFRGDELYVNGIAFVSSHPMWKQLADTRRADLPRQLDARDTELVRTLHRRGFIVAT